MFATWERRCPLSNSPLWVEKVLRQARRPPLSLSCDVVIVTWNSREDTLRCLQAVVPQADELAGRGSVIVVDNGSSDGTAEAIRQRHRSVVVVPLDSNTGFTGGVGSGVARSSADTVVLLNNDAIPEPGWLGALVNAMETASPDTIAAGGKILDATGQRADFVGGMLTFDGHAFQRDFRRLTNEVTPPADGEEILFACGGNMIVRRREFLDLGGFDPDYFAYLEDVDFGWRSWLSGYRCIFLNDALVRHKSSATSDRLGAYERGVLFEKNAIQTAIKNYDDELFARFAAPMFLSLLHRQHRYVTDRNGDTAMLRRTPLGSDQTVRTVEVPPDGLLSRMRRSLGRKIAVRPGAVVLDDPLTAMQFRATEWLFRNEQQLMAKRSQVQSRRKRPDSEIFAKFPIHYIPTYPGDGDLMSSALFRALRPDVHSVDKSLEEIMDP
ncbi:MAG: glycosyltransferase family 2 protein [Acidobacteriota bacterium]